MEPHSQVLEGNRLGTKGPRKTLPPWAQPKQEACSCRDWLGYSMLPEPQPLNDLHNEEEGEQKQIILLSKWTEQRQGIPHRYS